LTDASSPGAIKLGEADVDPFTISEEVFPVSTFDGELAGDVDSAAAAPEAFPAAFSGGAENEGSAPTAAARSDDALASRIGADDS
jgi:hypothetical protein